MASRARNLCGTSSKGSFFVLQSPAVETPDRGSTDGGVPQAQPEGLGSDLDR